MSMTTLDSSAELKTHIQALIELEPRFAPVYEQVGYPWRRLVVFGKGWWMQT